MFIHNRHKSTGLLLAANFIFSKENQVPPHPGAVSEPCTRKDLPCTRPLSSLLFVLRRALLTTASSPETLCYQRGFCH